MKISIFLAFCSLLIASSSPAFAGVLRDGDHLVFCGDSITCHSWQGPKGCHHLVTNALAEAGTVKGVTVTGLGFCGNTVNNWLDRELKTRPADAQPMLSNRHSAQFPPQDVKKTLDGKVDVITVLLGMNDILQPDVVDTDMAREAWIANYRRLATNLRTRTKARELVLGTFTPLTADPEGPKNVAREKMNALVRKLAAELGAHVWEAGPAAYATIAETRRRDPAYREAPDFVHPGNLGHLAMAAAFCRAVGEEDAAAKLDARRTKLLDETLPPKPGVSYRLFPRSLGEPDADRLAFDLVWNVNGLKATDVTFDVPEGWTATPAKAFCTEGTVRLVGRPDRWRNVVRIRATDGKASVSADVPVAAPWRVTTETGDCRLALATWDYLGRCSSASVDLYQVLFGNRTDTIVAERWLITDRPRTFGFKIGTEAFSATQDFVVTLNGEEVWRGDLPRGKREVKPEVKLDLKTGANALAVRVGHREWQRHFTFDLVQLGADSPAVLRYNWRPASVVFLGGETIARFDNKVYRRTFVGAPYQAERVVGTNLTAGLAPKAVVVCAGEDKLSVPAEDAIVHVMGIVQRARVTGAKVVLCAIPPRGKTATDPLRKRIATINTQLRNFADGRNVLWTDCTEQLLFPDGSYVPELQIDGAYLTQYGYEIFAASVLPAVNHILRDDGTAFATEWPTHADPNAYAKEPMWSKIRLGRCGDGAYGGSWSGRPEAIRRRIREKADRSFDVVFCGDSITHLWEAVGKSVYAELCAKYDILNLGYCGDQTGHLLWRFENGELDGYTAKLFMVMVGTNNPGSPEERAEGVREVVRVIRARHPESKVLLLPIFPCGEKPDNKGRLRNLAANELIKPIADGKTVLWLDFNDRFLSPDGTISTEILYDFLHPSEKGYRLWADAVEPTFCSVCGK